MKWFKHDRLVGMFAVAAMFALLIEAVLVVIAGRQARHARGELDLRLHERDSLLRQAPALSDETREMIVREIATATERVTAESAKLRGATGPLLAGPFAASPVDAYFQITGLVESSRERLVSNGITIKAGERFGFSSHSRTGPNVELCPVVLLQCAATRRLLEELAEARPVALLSVQRERPAAVKQRERQSSKLAVEVGSPSLNTKVEDPEDFFDLVPAISIGLFERVETTAFKIEFSGHTPVLRDFLNRLASGSLPFVVRTVEVEPLTQTLVTASAPSKVLPSDEIVVVQNASRFTVVVELVTRMEEVGKSQS